ncbi:uncharacterized protein [Lepeophtheirus salmonis]|uniref:uncharacterized protein isoform X2 n=1 Tax=Lepeophtheirus salmonis TaxID=72036 RepID=UPI001AEA1A3E|nr:uncharacterized protein LOC121125239 isoform X2 [Lepeophtheirus salmonis]
MRLPSLFERDKKVENVKNRKLMDGLRCIDNFTFRCLDREHRAYFNTLYAGTTQVIVDLCTEGSYQTDYLRHAPCMREVQNGYERCAADYQYRIKNLNSKQENGGDNERNVKLLCCSFQNYLFCSERIVNSTCGPETARFTKSFLDRMSGPLIQGHCQAYEQGLNENCFSENYSDSGYSPSSSSGSSSSSEQSRGSLQNPFSSSAPSLQTYFPHLILLLTIHPIVRLLTVSRT